MKTTSWSVDQSRKWWEKQRGSQLLNEKVRPLFKQEKSSRSRFFHLTDTFDLAVNIHNEHFMVSRNVNPVFTGREEEIKNLQRSLCPSHATNLQATWSKVYVIHGLGGAGKSEVALKFAHDNRAE